MKSNYTHIAMVLDRSGSMASIADDTIGGVNTFLDAHRKAPGECTATLVQFANVTEVLCNARKIAEAPALTKETYIPCGGTALYDAVGNTIAKTGDWLMQMPEAQRPEKVIVAIITDGYENASREYTQAEVFEMIKHQREVYKWEFVFIGANQDALQTGAGMAIPATHSMNYAANAQGSDALYTSVASNSVKMRCGSKADMSWEKQDRDAQTAAGAPTSQP